MESSASTIRAAFIGVALFGSLRHATGEGVSAVVDEALERPE